MHRFIRPLAFAPVFLFAFTVHAQSVPEGTFPLPETYFPDLKVLIDSAAKQSPRMIARNTENAVAEMNRIAARSGQLPSAGGYLSYYPETTETRAVGGTDANGNPRPDAVLHPKKLTYSFTITQPVFHWGALHNTTKIGELQKKITEGQSAEVYRLLIDEIRVQYLQVIVYKSALARTRFSQQIADENLALARSKREQNVIAEAELFGPTIAAEQARIATDQAQDTYESSLIYLGKLSGSRPLSDGQIPTEIPAITPASSALQSITARFTDQAEPDTYYLETMRDQIATERLNYKVAASRLRPKLNAVAGVSQDEFSYSINIADKYKVQTYFAGVSVSWSVFDGFATRSAKRSSLARRRQLEENYRNQIDDTVTAVKAQLRQLEFAARNLALTERLLGSANDMVAAKQEDLNRGVASEAELNAIKLNLHDRQLAAYAARNDYMLKVARLLSATQNDPALMNVPAQW